MSRLAIGVAITAVPVVLLVAVLRTRVVPDMGRLDTFAARLRRACAVASVGLLIAYIASIAADFVVANQVGREIDRMCAGEARLIRAYPAKAPTAPTPPPRPMLNRKD